MSTGALEASSFVKRTLEATLSATGGKGGTVWTWGKGVAGELGHDGGSVEDGKICPFPVMVPALRGVVCVACGESSSAAVTVDGALFTWGSGRGGRLGHGDEINCARPRRVDFFASAGMRVHSVSLGENHAGCVAGAEHAAYCWGKNGCGCLGDGTSVGMALLPVRVIAPKAWRRGAHAGHKLGASEAEDKTADEASEGKRETVPEPGGAAAPARFLVGVRQLVCGFQATLALACEAAQPREGGPHVLAWGSNACGKLGIGATKTRSVATPTPVRLGGDADADADPADLIAMGSLTAGAVTRAGAVWMWGLGSHGNLGQGDRKSHASPVRVRGALAGKRVVSLHCTVSQINPAVPPASAGAAAVAAACAGKEGPHTMAVTSDGGVYAWGTSHKGLLGNVRDKILVLPEADELTPYRIGDACRDHPSDGPSGYLAGRHGVQAVASSIHSAVLDDAGDVHTFGCASDGRMGIRKYMTGLAGKRSRMKCYVSRPTPIEAFSEGGVRVLQIDTARRHMIALGVRGGRDAGSDPSAAGGAGASMGTRPGAGGPAAARRQSDTEAGIAGPRASGSRRTLGGAGGADGEGEPGRARRGSASSDAAVESLSEDEDERGAGGGSCPE